MVQRLRGPAFDQQLHVGVAVAGLLAQQRGEMRYGFWHPRAIFGVSDGIQVRQMLSRVLLNARLVWLVVEFLPPVQQDWQQRLPQQEQTVPSEPGYSNQVFVYCSMSVGQVSPARQSVAVSIHLAFFSSPGIPSRTLVVVPGFWESRAAVLFCRRVATVVLRAVLPLTQFLRRLARTSLGLWLFVMAFERGVQVQSDGPENALV